MESVKLEVGQLFGALGDELQRSALITFAATGALTAANLALDEWIPGSGSFAIAGFLSLIAQYVVTRFALARAGLLPEDAPNRFASLWGMNIVAGLLSLVGFILLIIPGVYMNARWMIAAPIIIAEDKNMGEGMSESWELMQVSVWPVVGALLILYVCGFGIGMAPLFLIGEEDPHIGLMATSYFVISLTSALGWLMAVGAYRLISHQDQSLEEIFA